MFAPQGWLQGRGNRSVYRTIASSDMFDKDWYRRENLTGFWKLTDPIWHYIRRGWRHRVDPSPRFDTKFYLTWNKDVRESSINPLDHYLTYGSAEGRPPLRPLAQWWPAELVALQPIKFYVAPPGVRQRISLVIDANTPNRWRGDGALLVIAAQWIASHLARDVRVLLRNGISMPSSDRSVFLWPHNTPQIQVTQIPEGLEYSDIDRYDDEIFIATSWSSATCLHDGLGGKNILYFVTANEESTLPGGDAQHFANQALSLPDVTYVVMSGVDSAGVWPQGSTPKNVIDSADVTLGSFTKSPTQPAPEGPLTLWAGHDANASRVRSILSALELLVARGAIDPEKNPITVVGEAAQRVLLLGTYEVLSGTPQSLTEEISTIQKSSLLIAATGTSDPHPVALTAASLGRNALGSLGPSSTVAEVAQLIEQAHRNPQLVAIHTDTQKLEAIADFVEKCGKHLTP